MKEIHSIIDTLSQKSDSKIVMLVADGLGGMPMTPDGKTELETAKMPNLDKIVPASQIGLLDPVQPGITPGSGPGHLGIFGYDPLEANIGRGVLSALGVNFDLKHGDLCARINLCTIDGNGIITDRRAGRIATDQNIRIMKKLNENINVPDGVQLFLETEKEHRAGMVLRGKKFYADIADTDPQKTGLAPLDPAASDPAKGEETVEILKDIIAQAKAILADEPQANMMLLRGFAEYSQYPTMQERFKMKSLALATYPMYRGLAKLIGMDVNWNISTMEEQLDELKKQFNNYDFFFIHIKKTDSYGEDGNFEQKVKVIESIDTMIPKILELNPDVLILTCDHSTPAKMKAHSWHRIPSLIYSQWCRPDRISTFNEYTCRGGSLTGLATKHLIPIAMAHAGKLAKFGA
ncbi:MAG: 2,3-bisphosphoglycerate-independent phosphoglycerate mutase [Candidatus Auribacterota bacterium]